MSGRLSVLLLVRSYSDIWQNMLKTEHLILFLYSNNSGQILIRYKGEYILMFVDWRMLFILLIKKLCISENMLEFIKKSVLQHSFVGNGYLMK